MEDERYKSRDELPAVLGSDDIVKFLGISKSKVYQMMRIQDFKSFRVGNRWFIERDNFLEWLDDVTYNN